MVADAGSASSASSRARTGSSDTSAADASSITATENIAPGSYRTEKLSRMLVLSVAGVDQGDDPRQHLRRGFQRHDVPDTGQHHRRPVAEAADPLLDVRRAHDPVALPHDRRHRQAADL